MNRNKMSQEEFERIEHYLNDEMSVENRKDFEKEMDQNLALAEAVNEVRIMMQAIEEDTLINKMNAFHGEHFEQASNDNIVPHAPQKKSYFKLGLVASIVLLLGLAGYFYTSQSSNNEKLYAEYFQPDPGLTIPMSATDNYDFYRGMVDYKQGKYQLAATRWEKLVQVHPENDTLNFYLGIINLIQEKPIRARSLLQQASQEKNSVFHDDILFYLALIELKQDHLKKAKQFLEQSNSPKAKELLNKILR